MHLTFDTVLYAVGLTNSLFFSLLFFSIRRGNLQANRYLAAFFLMMALLMLELIFEYTNFFFYYPHFTDVLSPFILAWGPFFYFYAQTLSVPYKGFGLKQLWHFLPMLLCFALFVPFYLQDTSSKLQYLQDLYAEKPVGHQYANWLGMPHLLIYIALVYYKVRRHEQRMKGVFSSEIEKINLSWLKHLSLGLLITWILWVNFQTLEIEALKVLSSLLFLGVFFVLGFFATKQNSLFFDERLVMYWEMEGKKGENKTSRVSDEKIATLKPALMKLMEEEKVFRQNDLTLPQLAALLSTSTNVLSELINTEIGTNFYDFVNLYRLEESKRLLKSSDYKHYTVLAIAYEAGFNSKTTFNTVFKKNEGLTPSDFRKQYG